MNLQSDDIPRCQTVYVHPFSPLTGGYLTIPFLSFLQFSCFLLFLPQKYNILFVFQIKLGKNTIFLLSGSTFQHFIIWSVSIPILKRLPIRFVRFLFWEVNGGNRQVFIAMLVFQIDFYYRFHNSSNFPSSHSIISTSLSLVYKPFSLAASIAAFS